MVPPIQAVIFDYGGVLRGDSREDWNTVDVAAGLPPGSLWAAWHDIPEYRLSREGAIDGSDFRTAIHRALIPVAGDAARAESVMAALEAHLAALPPVDADMRALVDRLRAGRRLKLGLLSNANRGYTERFRAQGHHGPVRRRRGLRRRRDREAGSGGLPARCRAPGRRDGVVPDDRRPAPAPSRRGDRRDADAPLRPARPRGPGRPARRRGRTRCNSTRGAARFIAAPRSVGGLGGRVSRPPISLDVIPSAGGCLPRRASPWVRFSASA